jgi:uncharacterized protein (DUF488 family)
MTDAGTILTIGHSTRSAAEFLSLLQAHRVTGVADVRTVPRSRRHPHFSSDALSAFWRSTASISSTCQVSEACRPRPTHPTADGVMRDFAATRTICETPAFRDELEALSHSPKAAWP